MTHKISTFVFVTLFLGIANLAHAGPGTDVGFMLGVKDANFSNSTAGETFTSEAGWMAGAIAVGPISGDLYFRAGGYFAQRVAKASTPTANSTITLDYLDVPLTVLYKFGDMFGVFGGLDLGIKLSDSCPGDAGICSVSGAGYDSPSGFVTAAQVGVNVKFHPNWAGELFYEIGLGDISTSTTANAISADIMFIY